MSRKRLAVIACSLLVVLAAAAGGVGWALYQVPDFYNAALRETPEPAVRQQEARQFVRQTMRLVDDIRHEPEWSEEFRQQQINSWLAEELTDPKYADLVPPGVSDPRVALDGGLIRLGFRVRHNGWEGVVSLRIRPWVPAENQLALEIQSVKVGLVPYPLDEVLGQVVRAVEDEGWRVEWQQASGNDVLIVHLDRGRPDDPVLENLEVVAGAIRLQGRSATKTAHAPFETLHVARQSDRP